MRCIVGFPANAFGPHDDFDPESGHVIPSLIDQWESHRQQVQRLRQEVDDKDAEIAALRAEIDELRRERTEIAEATSSYLHEINRVTTEVARRLKGTDDRVRVKSTLRAV